MDVAEQIVSEYLKMNGFTFVTNIKYERNNEIDIIASKNSKKGLVYYHIEIQSTISWKLDKSYIKPNLRLKFKEMLNPTDTQEETKKYYEETIKKYLGPKKINSLKKIWIHWEIKPDIKNNDTKFQELKNAAKEANVDCIIELKNILLWMIHMINDHPKTSTNFLYFDHSQNDPSFRYIELITAVLEDNFKNKKLPKLMHDKRKKLHKDLGLLKPDDIECPCDDCKN